MDGSSHVIYTEVLIFFFLLFMSGFFSSSEVVFFGANRYILRLKSHRRIYASLLNLLSKPREVLLTILIGNELVNVLISSYGTKLFVDLFGSKGVGLAVVLSSLLIFVFGEVLPKNVVLHFTSKLAGIYYLPFLLVHGLLYPLRVVFLLPVSRLIGMLDVKDTEKAPSEQFLELFEMGLSYGYFDKTDRELLEKALYLEEVTVKEVMTPKPDIFMLSEDAILEDVIQSIIQNKHSKIPLYSESPDHVVGMINVKDLVPIRDNLKKPLKTFKREALFVPEILTLTELLKRMRAHKAQTALVVGEHGELSGLVSLHDILTFIFGRVPENWEEDITKVSRDTFMVSGWADIEGVAKRLGFYLPEDYEYDTVGGFVMAKLSKVPEEGDEFVYDGFKFIVNKMEGNRVVNVFITSLQEDRV
ncbi:MAG: HlyC/CorC family transporter [Acidobacteria bacterium]|jgi:CBS domain containing-hemolysin-like protein|nr:MAG: HlyC/CorC family transporter [Acidobacteriota bacterium]